MHKLEKLTNLLKDFKRESVNVDNREDEEIESVDGDIIDDTDVNVVSGKRHPELTTEYFKSRYLDFETVTD